MWSMCHGGDFCDRTWRWRWKDLIPPEMAVACAAERLEQESQQNRWMIDLDVGWANLQDVYNRRCRLDFWYNKPSRSNCLLCWCGEEGSKIDILRVPMVENKVMYILPTKVETKWAFRIQRCQMHPPWIIHTTDQVHHIYIIFTHSRRKDNTVLLGSAGTNAKIFLVMLLRSRLWT